MTMELNITLWRYKLLLFDKAKGKEFLCAGLFPLPEDVNMADALRELLDLTIDDITDVVKILYFESYESHLTWLNDNIEDFEVAMENCL